MTTIAFASLVLVLYTYAGYPALVALWARLFPTAANVRSDYEPTVSICVAAYNGSAHILPKLLSLQCLEYPPEKIQILVFSDGSTDETEALVREFAQSDARIVLLSEDTRRGKPAALNRLRAAADGEVLLMCDVRQPLAKGALRALVRSLSDPTVGCASGSLVLIGQGGAGMYGRYEHFIRGSEARAGSMVGVAGSIYAIRRSDMPEVPADVLLDDMFVPLRVVLSTGKRIVLADGAEAYDAVCDDAQEFVRKVRTLAGNYQLLGKMPGLLVPGMNPVWFQLTSHKLARLACPWALVGLFVSSGLLASRAMTTEFWKVLSFSQLVFYLLALIGRAAGRLGVLARTFVILNAAAVVGLWRFIRRTQAVTW